MMNVLVLGANGMLGHKVLQALRLRFGPTRGTLSTQALPPSLQKVDLLQGDDIILGVNARDLQGLDRILGTIQPAVVVNCIGIIKQRPAAESAVDSIAINSLLPHFIAEACQRWGGRVIHFSTDCVFSGNRGRYTEDDPSDAKDLYGKSKFLGEVATANSLTLRTSIIGRELLHHRSLLEWLFQQNSRKIRGFRKAIYAGVTTNYLAEMVSHIVECLPDLSGLYQIASTPISKFELLKLLRDAYRLDIEIEPDDKFICDRSMLGNRFKAATGCVCPEWPELIQQLSSDPTPYERWLSND